MVPSESTTSAYNAAGQAVVADILDDPAGSVIMSYSNALQDTVYDIAASDGRAVRYGSAGNMIGLREP